MDSRVSTLLWVYGSIFLIAAIAFTGLINSFLPSVEKPKLIKRLALIFFSVIFLIIGVLFVLSAA